MKYLIIFFLFFTTLTNAQDPTSWFEKADEFFQDNIENGRVKYGEIKQNPKALNNLLAAAGKINISPDEEAEFKAFWINAYNLAVIAGIVKNYPVASPRDIEGFFDKITYNLGGKKLTLDEIEHKILLRNFPGEERFHFVLVCAAKSCPPIIAEAYKPEILDKQLQRQTEQALNDPQFVRITGNKVLFSEIMKWYKEDFNTGGKSLIQYANQFRKNKIPLSYKIDFYEYDWRLNE